MATGPLRDDVLKTYEADGFVIARGMFDSEEIGLLRRAAKEDRELDQHSFGRGDGEGGTVRLSLWNHPGDTLYGMFARCESMVNSAEKILGGEVYHYHSKMIMKDPKVGGAWTWHQDYGYWYQNGVLFPLLSSAFHRGRSGHPGERLHAGAARLAPPGPHRSCADGRAGRRRYGARGRGREVLELVYVEMEPGDTLFFHCNLLHRSDQNHSDNPRWSMICCYNAARNDPYKESHHPRYTPLSKVPDSAIQEAGLRRFSDGASDVCVAE